MIKKIFFVLMFAMMFASSAYLYQTGVMRGGEQKDTSKVIVDGHAVVVELAVTPQELEQGLMHRATLAKDSGMLFLFADSGKKIFWNKNTYIPLDIIWMHDDIVIGVSHLPAISDGLTKILSPDNVNRVLEVNHGWANQHSIQIGARVW